MRRIVNLPMLNALFRLIHITVGNLLLLTVYIIFIVMNFVFLDVTMCMSILASVYELHRVLGQCEVFTT